MIPVNVRLYEARFQRVAQERRNVMKFDFKENQICFLTIFPNY